MHLLISWWARCYFPNTCYHCSSLLLFWYRKCKCHSIVLNYLAFICQKMFNRGSDLLQIKHLGNWIYSPFFHHDLFSLVGVQYVDTTTFLRNIPLKALALRGTYALGASTNEPAWFQPGRWIRILSTWKCRQLTG